MAKRKQTDMASQLRSQRRGFFLVAASVIGIVLATCAQTNSQGSERAIRPSIQITSVPAMGGGTDRLEDIAGSATGVNHKECKVILFALGGDTWYVQPYINSTNTEINPDGRWKNETHLGSRYAALLVKLSYRPPPTAHTLPTVGGDILASVSVQATQSEHRDDLKIIRFSGYEWRVKSSSDRVGPGPNYFSATDDNVEVDEQGRLHLRITSSNGKWLCSEVISQQNFGYGTYRFYVDTNTDDLDINAVLGMFTWSDDPAYHHREIDIEVSRWGKANNENGQFVVQPYTISQNIVRFQIPSKLSGSTYSFSWTSNRVFCQSWRGHQADPHADTDIIRQYEFTRDIPRRGGENARINLWLDGGVPPADGKEIQLIITKFEFIPAGP